MLLWDVDAANTSTHSMGLKKQEFTGLAISTKSTIYIRDSDDIILCAEPLLIDPKLVTNLDFKFSVSCFQTQYIFKSDMANLIKLQIHRKKCRSGSKLMVKSPKFYFPLYTLQFHFKVERAP